jgi:hypothetical protein
LADPNYIAVAVGSGGLGAVVSGFLTYRYGLDTAKKTAKFNADAAAEAARRLQALALRDAIAILSDGGEDSPIRRVRKQIALLVRAAQTGQFITYERRASFYHAAYGLHAAVGWATIVVRRYQGTMNDIIASDEALQTLWALTRGLSGVLSADQSLAAIDPAIAPPPEEPELDPQPFLEVLFAPPGVPAPERIDTFGKHFERARRDELNAPLKPARNALRRFRPEAQPLLWRLLVTENMLCDMIEHVLAEHVMTSGGIQPSAHLAATGNVSLDEHLLASWPYRPEDRERLDWRRDGTPDPHIEAARRYVRTEILM